MRLCLAFLLVACSSVSSGGDTGPPDATASCTAGLTRCGSQCIDMASDPNHCGACGSLCCPGFVCSRATCVLHCAANEAACAPGGGGCPFCTDRASDNDNCGVCGTTCAVGQNCVAGSCTALDAGADTPTDG